jgi:hypothetical protein
MIDDHTSERALGILRHFGANGVLPNLARDERMAM